MPLTVQPGHAVQYVTTVQPAYRILSLDFDDTLFDIGADRLFNAAKLKQVLQAFHEAGVYLCVVSARGGRARMLKALDVGLGADRDYLKHDDIWTPEKIEELGERGRDFVAGSGKEVVVSYVVRHYNEKNPISAEKSDVLFTDDAVEHLDRVEAAGYKVLRFKVENDARGTRPEAAFLDNLYQEVMGKSLAPSLGASSQTLHASAAAAGRRSVDEGLPLLPRDKTEEEKCCKPCVLV